VHSHKLPWLCKVIDLLQPEDSHLLHAALPVPQPTNPSPTQDRSNFLALFPPLTSSMPLFQDSSHITIHGGTFYEVHGNFYNTGSVAGLPSTLGIDDSLTADERASGQSLRGETSWEVIHLFTRIYYCAHCSIKHNYCQIPVIPRF